MSPTELPGGMPGREDFATALAEGRTDPTWNNADANLQRLDWDPNTYPLDATVPWLRTQDQPDDTVLKT